MSGVEYRQCSAHLSNGSGARCKKRAMAGLNVCEKHGGSAPRAREAARRRLLNAADPAAARLVRSLSSEDERVAIKAAQLILDRAGIGAVSSVEVSGPDGGPVTTAHLDTSWIEHCTVEEKRAIIEIAERAMVRAGVRGDSDDEVGD